MERTPMKSGKLSVYATSIISMYNWNFNSTFNIKSIHRMKKIKDLTVTVTYTVGLHDVEVSEKVYDDLNALADKGRVNCDLMNLDEQVCTGFEWLSDHIHESDACDWNYEVDME
ncbi:hypothetical protein AS203_08155 [Hoylesella enoeca]|uniref:Uncharacterized protein n=3 Tax=Bacteroidia TaxID=200643 RepID=E6K6V4_9BACT|nr:hypothetical protein AS203_08155 [Hoylesella enoeca]EFU30784.1 hypothetical protein HMPREF6485_1353 [Segatella buccae ATCC 33574]